MRTPFHRRVPLTSIQDGQTQRVARRSEQHGPPANTRARVPLKQTGLGYRLPALRHVSSRLGVNAAGAADGLARLGGSGLTVIDGDGNLVGGG